VGGGHLGERVTHTLGVCVCVAELVISFSKQFIGDRTNKQTTKDEEGDGGGGGGERRKGKTKTNRHMFTQTCRVVGFAVPRRPRGRALVRGAAAGSSSGATRELRSHGYCGLSLHGGSCCPNNMATTPRVRRLSRTATDPAANASARCVIFKAAAVRPSAFGGWGTVTSFDDPGTDPPTAKSVRVYSGTFRCTFRHKYIYIYIYIYILLVVLTLAIKFQ
jgi:hypothetical protein